MRKTGILLAIVMLMAVVLTGCGETAPAEESPQTEVVTAAVTESQPEVTEPEITEPKEEEEDEPESDLRWMDAYRQLVNSFGRTSFEDPIGAYLYDIDGDGIPELFLEFPAMDLMFDVYTFRNGETVKAGEFYCGAVYKVPNYNGLYTFTVASPYGAQFGDYMELVNGGLIEPRGVGVSFITSVVEPIDFDAGLVWEYFLNDVKVSQSEFESKRNEYFNESNMILRNRYKLDDIEKMFSDYLG
jgi:predicted small lipoprotein YifL